MEGDDDVDEEEELRKMQSTRRSRRSSRCFHNDPKQTDRGAHDKLGRSPTEDN